MSRVELLQLVQGVDSSALRNTLQAAKIAPREFSQHMSLSRGLTIQLLETAVVVRFREIEFVVDGFDFSVHRGHGQQWLREALGENIERFLKEGRRHIKLKHCVLSFGEGVATSTMAADE